MKTLKIKKFVAHCLTKSDNLLSGSAESYLKNEFGFDPDDFDFFNITTNRIYKAFKTSAVGYYTDIDKKIINRPNINDENNGLAEIREWYPMGVANVFFWIFEQIEKDNWLNSGEQNWLFHKTLNEFNKRYINYPKTTTF